ncbi:nuclear transport factor 2 family protein [Shewanella aestuarii]|uniref:nuclear transport factor 2 family protein n=1 Tax=Shewanella aestuarii TaxID=1028752 RepID=UPI001FCB41D5|nr:nuclear transport factor 2 family protein [Shewanella aestuarii]
MPLIIEQFIALYQKLNKDNLHLLSDIYAVNITFRDPLHQVQGLEALTDYFANLYSNISFIEFDITEVFHSPSQQQVSLFWTMRYAHPKLNKGQAIHVDGMSKLQYNDKIFYHRDYFDVGQMLYEKIPFLGGLISMIKKRIG